jgi:hypothetical protein
MIAANITTARVARTLGLTAVGGSDAHVRHAIAWAHTRFDGRSARHLRRAIASGQTRAGRSPLGLAGLQRYAYWSIGRLRPQAVAG